MPWVKCEYIPSLITACSLDVKMSSYITLPLTHPWPYTSHSSRMHNSYIGIIETGAGTTPKVKRIRTPMQLIVAHRQELFCMDLPLVTGKGKGESIGSNPWQHTGFFQSSVDTFPCVTRCFMLNVEHCTFLYLPSFNSHKTPLVYNHDSTCILISSY